MNIPPLDSRVTPKEIAAGIGRTRGTIQEWITKGMCDPSGRRHFLQVSRIGRRYFTTWEDVHAFLDAVSPARGMPSLLPQPERLVELADAYESARSRGGERAESLRFALAGAIAISTPAGDWVRAGDYSYRLAGEMTDPIIERRREG